MATLVARVVVWEGPIYEVPEFVLRTPQELLVYALLGLVTGVASVVFLKVLRAGERSFARIELPRWVLTGIGGLLVGVIAMWLPEITGNGYASRHDPDGDWLYGMEVCVDPEFRGYRLGQRLYNERKKLCQALGLKGIVFAGRLPTLARRIGIIGVRA